MHIGRWIGNFAGKDQAAHVYADLVAGAPSLSWDREHADAVSVVLADGVELVRTIGASFDRPPVDAQASLEVWECTPETRREPLEIFCTLVGNHARIRWSEATGTPARYELRMSLTSGQFTGEPVAIRPAGSATYEVIVGPLPDETPYFQLTVYDAAGNSSTSAQASVTIDAAPAAPSGFALTHNDATGATTCSWTPGGSADLNHHHLYRAVDDPVELTAAPFAEPTSSPYVDDNSGVTGRVLYLLRSVDATGHEEANLSQMAAINLVAGVQVDLPNSPEIIDAVAIAAGQVRLTALYDRTDEAAIATDLNLYADDGEGGGINWSTPVGTAALVAGRARQVAMLESAGLVGAKTYTLGCRAATALGLEDANTATATVLTDATAPSAPSITVDAV